MLVPMTKWRTIPGWETYKVSDDGRVKGPQGERTLQLTSGYPTFNASSGSRRSRLTVHRCVAEAFLGPRPDGLEVNHKDGNKTNNHVDNLEYVTRSENHLHKFRLGMGGSLLGEAHQNSTTTEADVREIRRLYSTTRLSCREIGERFGLKPGHVWKIAKGKLWKHIPMHGEQEE